MNELIIKRGDIYYADLSPVVGSEQGGIRPVLIIQNNIGNRHSPTIICAAITSKMNKAKLPTHIEICTNDYNIMKNSVILYYKYRPDSTLFGTNDRTKICVINVAPLNYQFIHTPIFQLLFVFVL